MTLATRLKCELREDATVFYRKPSEDPSATRTQEWEIMNDGNVVELSFWLETADMIEPQNSLPSLAVGRQKLRVADKEKRSNRFRLSRRLLLLNIEVAVAYLQFVRST